MDNKFPEFEDNDEVIQRVLSDGTFRTEFHCPTAQYAFISAAHEIHLNDLSKKAREKAMTECIKGMKLYYERLYKIYNGGNNEKNMQ